MTETTPLPARARRERLLVCDDEKLIRDLLVRTLTARGFEVDEASDGEAALAEIRRSRPDLVLLDVMMPRMDGLEVVRALRADADLRGVQVIVLTARASQDALKEVLATGADDYIAKPFHLGEVISRVDAHLRIVRYAEELERKRQDSQTLVEISQRLTGRLDLPTILAEVAQRVSAVLAADRCSIVLLDADARTGRVVAASDSPARMDLRISVDAYPEIGCVVRTRAPLIVTDIAADPLFDPVKDQLAQLDVRSVALFPMFEADRLIGVLFLRSRAPTTTFATRECEFGQIVANATAVAVSNAEIFREIREETDRQAQARASAEQRLRRVQQYHGFFESAADATFITDEHGVVLFVNRQAEAMTGLSRVLACGLEFAALVVAEQRDHLRGMLAELAEGASGARADLELSGDLSGDRPITVSVNLARLPGEPPAFCLSARDVTQERAVGRELQRTRDFLQSLIDASLDAVVATTLGGRVLVFNRAAERLFAHPSTDVVGRRGLSDLMPPGGAAELAERLRAPEDGGDGRITPPLSRIVLGADGSTIPVLVSASTARSDHHETAVLFFFQDQREQLRIRSALEETQQRLDASEKQALLAELAGAAAHELNQPLTSVLGYAELLTRTIGAADPARRPLEVIHREASRMAEIVKQIGQITRYETTAYIGSTRILDLAASAGVAPPDSKPGEPT